MKLRIGILRSRDIKLNLISVILPLFAEATLTRLSNLMTLYKVLGGGIRRPSEEQDYSSIITS
jgi:hypothetical protein